MEERIAQLEKRVAELEGQVQTQPVRTAEEIIRSQIDTLEDIQTRASARGQYDTVAAIAEIGRAHD